MIKKAVFLDRDGVVIREVDHLCREDQLRLLPGVTLALRELNSAGWLVVLISNQAAVAKGILSEEYMYKIGGALRARIEIAGAKIDATYYCPHHPEGKIPKYTRKCLCRKPEPGMLFKATRELKVDLKKSYMVGDKTGDILAGKNAGTKTILVKTGYGGKDRIYEVKPDYVAKNLADAVKIIKKHA